MFNNWYQSLVLWKELDCFGKILKFEDMVDSLKYPTPLEEISSIEYTKEDCMLHKDEELKTTLEDLNKIENENGNLKENLKEANECIKNLREKIKKFKEIHREVNEQLKKTNEDITKLKIQVEEKKKTKDCLNAVIQRKTNECTRLEQEVVNLRADLEKARIYEDKFKASSTMLDELIAGHKSSKDKGGLGLERGENST